jgi:peptidoglycan-N-acetylglucosamine deacetylase
MTSRSATVAFFCLALGLSQSPSAATGGRVALTFDDLPVHAPLPKGLTRSGVMKQIVNALQHAGAPQTYGFLNANGVAGVADHEQALQIWRSAGFPLANHTYSHIDLHANETAAFEQNVITNEAMLAQLMGREDWRWFRYPFLREGNTREKRHAVRSFLADRQYKIAQVTMDFSDYAYNEPYARCMEKGDLAGIETLRSTYLREAAESLAASEAASQQLFGRNINHVMLLHVGGFQPMMLPHLFALLERRGYKLITLREAQSDPAYAEDPDVAMDYGTSFLNQIALKRNVPGIAYDEATITGLGQICR